MRRFESEILAPYRALGLICSSASPVYIPFTYKGSRSEGLIACPIGNVLCVYTVKPLRMLFTTSPFDSDIQVVAGDVERIYVGVGVCLSVIFHRKIERSIILPAKVQLIQSFTEILVVVDAANSLHVLDVENGDLLVQIPAPDSIKKYSAMVHPLTYKNKVLLGSSDGSLRLLNIRTGKLIYHFLPDANFDGEVTVLEQSTAVDIIAVGLANGKIHLRNIRTDEIICSFNQTKPITAIAFRTDDVGSMVTANGLGEIAVWDLNGQQLVGVKATAHHGSIVWMHFLLGQPFLLSSGSDNRIVKWILRNEHSLPELHSSLEGHAQPVTALRFCGESKQLISASEDGNVRRFTTGSVNRVKSFGLAREVRKGDLTNDRFVDVPLSPILQIEVSTARESVWDNIACRHFRSPLVSTWTTRRMKRGTHILCHDRFNSEPEFCNAFCTSLSLSACGNFAILGYSSGHLDVFNMQSGRLKFSFVAPVDALLNNKNNGNTSQQKNSQFAHMASVTGVAFDLVSQNVMSGAADGSLHFWRFKPAQLRSRMLLHAGIVLIVLNRFNSLLAVSLENGELGIVDTLCHRVARLFKNTHSVEARATALEFANDGKWLLSADDQGFIKIWDLPGGLLIDFMRLSRPCVGLSFSEAGDYLATCHQGERGVFLWANKQLFLAGIPKSNVAKELRCDSSQSSFVPDPEFCQLPSISTANNDNNIEEIDLEDQEDECDPNKATTTSYKNHTNNVEMVDRTHTHCRGSPITENVDSKNLAQKATRVVVIDEEDDDDRISKPADDQEMIIPDDTSSEQPSDNRSQLEKAIQRSEQCEQIGPGLITLSGLPPSRWAFLSQLPEIRERNKPILPPQKPKALPFFLPATSNIEGFIDFDQQAIDEVRAEAERERKEEEHRGVATPALMARRRLNRLNTTWTDALIRASTTDQLLAIFLQLKTMSVSAIDFHIRCLDTIEALSQFVKMLCVVMERRKEFDLCQSYLAAFLRIHHQPLWSLNGALKAEMKDDEEQEEGDEDEDNVNDNVEAMNATGQKRISVEIEINNAQKINGVSVQQISDRTNEQTQEPINGGQQDLRLSTRRRKHEDRQNLLTMRLEKLFQLQQEIMKELQPLHDACTSIAEFIKSAVV